MVGQRWAIDLGSGNYALRGYWNKGSADGERYSYYRKSTRGHNTLTFGGWDGHPGVSNQLVGGKADRTLITDFRIARDEGKSAVVNMTDAYKDAQSVVRTFHFDTPMTTLTITDTFAFLTPGVGSQNVTWTMHTRASISINQSDPSRAVLSQGGVELSAWVREPVGASFTSASVDLKPPQLKSNGIRKLMIVTTVQRARIVVSLTVVK